MSKTTKKKFVVDEVLNNYDLPTGDQKIVKIIRSCGNNLHEVQTPEGSTFLTSMPTRFRKHIWIKRGDFVVVEPIQEGAKVKGEILQILFKDQIKYFKEQGAWPKGFSEENKKSDHSSDTDLFVNTNRPDVLTSSSDDSSTDVEPDDT